MTKSFKKIQSFLVNQDMYGHAVGINFKGKEVYQTRLGSFCTLATYVLMLVNILVLTIAFTTGTNQEEKQGTTQFDRSADSEKYNWNDYNLDAGLVHYPPMPPNIGTFRAYQRTGGSCGDVYDCVEKGFAKEIPLGMCSENQQFRYEDYWVPRIGELWF